MGLFSSLFSKKEKQVKVSVTQPETNAQSIATRGKKRGVADPSGLYPSELVLLSVAHKYRVNETEYPRYLTYDYGIINPNVELKQLERLGYIRRSTAAESLPSLKVLELKQIAEVTGTICKKNKSDLVEALSRLDETILAPYVKDSFWVVTEAGQTVLNYNRYIDYFLEKHTYSLEEVGIDIWVLNKLVNENPKSRYRDLIWGLLNEKQMAASVELQTNRYSGTANSALYCNVYKIMGLFVEEEKSYVNGADYYFQYLYKWVNIHASLDLLIQYSSAKDKIFKDKALEWFYILSRLNPYQKETIIRFTSELGVDEDGLRHAMRIGFERSKDSGVFSYDEFVDFIMLELTGDIETSKAMCIRLAKTALKKAGIK